MRVLAELAKRAAQGKASALATVVATEGSSPAKSAMRMLVGESGRVSGTVGGGHVEASIEQAARETLASGKHTMLSFTFDDDMADEGGLICGGTIRVLVERVEPPALWAARAVDVFARGRRAALVARIGDSVERELIEGDAADEYLRDEKPRVDGTQFIEPLFRPRCILLGAGHVGRAVARIAAEAGFGVAIVEDRAEQAAQLEAERVVVGGLVDGLQELDPGPDDYVVVMTRGTGLDLDCVRAGLSSRVRYVGLLASRRKRDRIVEALANEGVDTERLHAPIGLDLGALSAGEIAVSVVAQLIKVRRMGRGDR